MEKQSCLKGTLVFSLRSLSLGIIIKTKRIVATCFENMVVIIISLSEKFIINVDRLTIFAHVEIAISEPETVFDLDVDVSLTFEQGDSTNPISGFYVVFESRHFLLLDFIVLEVFGADFGDFGFGDGSSWSVHWLSYVLSEDFKFVYNFSNSINQ